MEALSTLKEIQGVLGGFLVDTQGKVIANDLPSYIREAIDHVGARLLHTAEALGMFNGDQQLCSLNFKNYRLILRSSEVGLVSVLAERQANLAALRMALNLVARQLARQTSQSNQAPLSQAPALSLPSSQPAPSSLTPLPQPVSDFSSVAPTGASQFTPSPPPVQTTSATPVSTSTPPLSSKPSTSSPPAMSSAESGVHTQEDGSERRKKRPVYFRGKRVG